VLEQPINPYCLGMRSLKRTSPTLNGGSSGSARNLSKADPANAERAIPCTYLVFFVGQDWGSAFDAIPSIRARRSFCRFSARQRRECSLRNRPIAVERKLLQLSNGLRVIDFEEDGRRSLP
jgi:hypothetical protein